MRFPFRKVVYAVSLVAVVWIFLAVVLFVEGRHFELNSAQAIVVLGARVKPNGNASFALQARVEHAVNLFNQKRAPKMIFTGGKGDFGDSESAVAQRVAESLGVSPDACLREEISRSTVENARETRAILNKNGFASINEIVLVTDGFHLARATYIFRKLGFVVHPSPADDWPSNVSWPIRIWWTLREVPAFAKSAVQLAIATKT
jgi:uncharacterized SAM-binding protein YcdF (DUF218 family)